MFIYKGSAKKLLLPFFLLLNLKGLIKVRHDNRKMKIYKITDIEKLKFPIGKFEKPKIIDNGKINYWISDIELFPKKLNELVSNLTDTELHWKYRPDGWTIKQIIHRCADSHMNSFIRFKLNLTEKLPTIKPYFEGKWAELPDSTEADISESLKIIEGLHSRWTILLRGLKSNDFNKEFIHPEHGKRFSIAENIGVYAWHSNHHLKHIKQAISKKGKFD